MGYFVDFKGFLSKNENTKKTSVFLVVLKISVASNVGSFAIYDKLAFTKQPGHYWLHQPRVSVHLEKPQHLTQDF